MSIPADTTNEFSLTHLAFQPRTPEANGGDVPPLLVLLHGVGSNERDLPGLAEYVDGRFFVVSARGPLTHAQSGGAAWYPVTFTPQGYVADESAARASREKILRFIEEATVAYGTDPRRVYLMGFSQGAIMSLFTALTQPDRVAGVVAMSGRVLPDALAMRAPDDALRGLPIIAVHGTYDRVISIEQGREVRDLVGALPVDLTYKEYAMGHEVSAESIADIAAWVKARLGA
jgi:phospholipase/carboxylesterase